MSKTIAYNTGPATRAKGVGFYGHHRLGKARKAYRERIRMARWGERKVDANA